MMGYHMRFSCANMGMSSIEVREHRGDEISTPRTYFNIAETAKRSTSRKRSHIAKRSTPRRRSQTAKLSTPRRRSQHQHLGDQLLGALMMQRANGECKSDTHRCIVFRKSLIHDQLLRLPLST